MKRKNAILAGQLTVCFIISSPVMAQSVLNPQSATGDFFQVSVASISADATGLTALAVGNQLSGNSVNQMGDGTSALSVSNAFGFGQVIGGGVSTDFNQYSDNSILAQSIGSLLSNATVSLSGSGQTASNAANSATFGVSGNSSGSLQQALTPDLISGQSSNQTAVNIISAVAAASNASILGNGNSQAASNSINSAVFLATGTASLRLDQKSNDSIASASSNNATAQVTSAGNPVIEPLVTSLSQFAGVDLNSVSAFGGNALTIANAGANAGQGLSFVSASSTPSFVSTANEIQSRTGTGTAPPLLGTGTSQITGNSQATRLTLNTVASSGVTTFGDIDAPFLQSLDSTGLNVQGSGVGSFAGVNYDTSANLLLAGTNAGGAIIEGSNTVGTQVNSWALNSVSSGGGVNGALTQDSTGSIGGLHNTAIAVAATGPAKIVSVSQGQNLSLNTLSGAGGNDLNLRQTAAGGSLLGDNAQVSNTTLGIAAIGGALQQSTSSINVATLGALGSGSIFQAANSVSQSMNNALSASGGASQVGGSQGVMNISNAIK